MLSDKDKLSVHIAFVKDMFLNFIAITSILLHIYFIPQCYVMYKTKIKVLSLRP